ncbi:MAG: hypothetical protein ACOYOS_09175 [Syntrophales bacterium]
MVSLNGVPDVTTTDGTDRDPMEEFHLHHVLPVLTVEFLMDSDFEFNERFLTFLSNQSGLSGKMIWSVLNNIRKPVYADSLVVLSKMIIQRVGITGREDILDESFTEKVEDMIIRSKHNEQVRQITDAAWTLVERIFADNGSDLASYSSVQKCQLKKVIVYILVVMMQVYLQHNLQQPFEV